MAPFTLHATAIVLLASLLPNSLALELKNRQSSIQAASPFDHTWIEEFAALGDSFSIGEGAGNTMRGSDKVKLNPGSTFSPCYQYSDGYPNLINAAANLGSNPNRILQYFGCSGAKSSDILNSQVPMLQSPQLVTLTAGGNDIGFSQILNYCVFQWFTPFWGPSCDSVLQSAKDTVNGGQFTTDLSNLLAGIKSKLRGPNGRILWLSYARFWDTATNECDSVTWAYPSVRSYEYLTRDKRKSMNELTDMVNQKIQDVVSAAGPQVVFVPVEDDLDAITGRMCEPGVDEHWQDGHGAAENREQTVFYEWGTTKDDFDDPPDAHDDLKKRQNFPTTYNGAAANTTLEGQIANYIMQGKIDNPASYTNPNAPLNMTFDANGIPLPGSWSRIMHPNKFGQSIWAARAINVLTQEQAKIMNQPAVTKTFTRGVAAAQTAPPNAPHSSSPSSTTTSSASAPSISDMCDVTYDILFDHFDVRGKNFGDPAAPFTEANLKTQIRGCGDLTLWTFEQTPTDPNYQWHAYGNLPIGPQIKGCVERALKSAGGPTVNTCSGSG